MNIGGVKQKQLYQIDRDLKSSLGLNMRAAPMAEGSYFVSYLLRNSYPAKDEMIYSLAVLIRIRR